MYSYNNNTMDYVALVIIIVMALIAIKLFFTIEEDEV
jgi:hypothetical protein